jgi:mono/diheme cytochrome c family protein
MKALRILAICVGVAALAGAADTKKAAASGDPAKGKAVFEAQACNTCHSVGTDKIMGPGLKGLFARPKLQNGKKPTEATVGAVIDEGGNGMPPYKEMLKSAERRDLIAYLKTL